MSFRRLDEDAYTSGYALHSALGVRAWQNAAAAWETPGRSAAVAYLYSDPVQACGIPSGVFGVMERSCIPYLWRKAAGCETLELRARLKSMRAGLGCVVGVCAGRPGELIGGQLPANENEVATTSGVETVALELDVRRFGADELIVVLLTVTSDLSEDYEAWTNGGLSTAGLVECQAGWIELQPSGAGWDWHNAAGSTAYADDLTPWAVEMGANLSAFTKQPDYDGAFGDRRLALRFDDHKVFAWPPYDALTQALITNAAAANGYYVIRRAVGYIELYGVEINEIAFEAIPDNEARAYHIGQATGAATADLLYRRSFRAFTERGRALSLGNGPNTARLDNATSGAFPARRAEAACPRVQIADASILAGGASVPVFGAVCGSSDTFENGGDTWTRSRLRCDTLAVFTTFARGNNPRCELELTLSVGDLAASTPDDLATFDAGTPALHPTASNTDEPGFFVGCWFHFLGAETLITNKRIRHCLSGMIPGSLWPSVGWSVNTVEVLHTVTGNARDEVELAAAALSISDTREVWMVPVGVLVTEPPGAVPDRLGTL